MARPHVGRPANRGAPNRTPLPFAASRVGSSRGYETLNAVVSSTKSVVPPPVSVSVPVHLIVVTTTDEEPAVVGEPEMRPAELIDSPAGRPVAEYVRLRPPESVPEICKLTEEPTVVVWVPGLVTVSVLPVELPPHSVAGRAAPFGVASPEAMS